MTVLEARVLKVSSSFAKEKKLELEEAIRLAVKEALKKNKPMVYKEELEGYFRLEMKLNKKEKILEAKISLLGNNNLSIIQKKITEAITVCCPGANISYTTIK